MTAIQYGPGETPTRILRWEGSSWVSEAAPAWGGTVAAGDGSLFFQGLHGLWLRDGDRWIPRPAPQDRVIVAVLPRTKEDIYFLLFPSSVLHYDGSGFTPIPIEGVVSGRTEPGAPVNLASRGEHLWLHSTDRVWKLAPEDTPQPAPVTF
jgi:hypothetical protein